MPRDISEHGLNQFESRNSDDVKLIFCRVVDHNGVAEHIVSEGTNGNVSWANGQTIHYRWRGALWVGLPFRHQWLTDDERGPRGSISIPNIDRRIGHYARALDSGSTIWMAMCWLSDWDLTLDSENARSPSGADPDPEMQFVERQYLKSISGDALAVEAEFGPRPYDTEPYPSIRSTPPRYPALYR